MLGFGGRKTKKEGTGGYGPKMKKIVGTVLKVGGAALLIAVLVGLIYVVRVMSNAPAISILDAAPEGYRSSVLDESGEVILTLSEESSNRVYVKLEEVPESLQNALIATEDARFYKHHGVDVKGILRAIVKGIRNGGVTEGASTITQQLLKNNVFDGWMEESSFKEKLERKIQEQYLALVLEKNVSKEWILENYLNTINLGGGNWGVETAARYYFDKDVSDLTLSESAVLAAIPKNPTKYNPRLNPEENAGRRELVLSNMLEQGYITQEEYDEALADPVYDRIAAASSGSGQETFSYFEDALITTVLRDLQTELGYSEEEAWHLIYSGGLTIRSTVDSSLQTICEETASDDSLFPSDEEVSIVMVDNSTGQVRAMIGGRGEKTASLVLNRATDSVRQPGSTIKIIGEYAAGLDASAFTLGTVVDDAPYTYSDGTDVSNASGTYRGMTTIRNAIIRSNNVVALKCFQEEGIDTVWAQLLNFGISTLTDADKVEALALGGTSGGVTNLEMTSAYSAIARGGEYREPIYYTQILDHDGNVLLNKEQDAHEAVSLETAALLTDAMSDVVTSGTGTKAAFSGMTIAGKSGTTTDNRDAWFIGYSPYYACGVWGGFDDNGEQESGGYVQEIWKAVMSRAHESLSDASFSGRDGLVSATICTKCGYLAVEGLCDSTEQGDMTAVEYFESGTEPTRTCTCHVSVDVCQESGEKAGSYCTNVTTKVYLKTATAGTEDAEYVIPESLESGTCQTHRHFWSSWFHNDDDDSDSDSQYGTQPYGSEESPSGSEENPSGGSQEGGHWWNWIFGG